MATCMHIAIPQALSILLLASMLLVSSGEPPSSYQFELIHVDANGGFTREELIHRAAERTFLRAATLSATDSTASSTKYSATAIFSHYEYQMELQIGNPPEPFMAVADTGSDVTWTKKKTLCGYRDSSGFTKRMCPEGGPDKTWDMCKGCWKGVCMFTKTYGRQKLTAIGFIGNDMVHLSQETDGKANIEFGCAFNCDDCDKILPDTADGVVGLSRSPNSILAQLKMTKFSYCLSNQSNPEARSPLWFGKHLSLTAAGGSGAIVQTTPLANITTINPEPSVEAYRYYVELDGISVGGKYKNLEVDGFKLKSNNSKGGMFIDSGCSFSHLETAAFKVLKELLAENNLIETTSPNKNFTCYEAAAGEPEMVLHFTHADMHLPWASYMFKDASVFCLAIKETTVISILGNFQQQNIHMLYDLDGDKLSFVRVDDCKQARMYV